MTEPTVLVDPLCLCQRPHPCPLHGAWAGQRPASATAVRLDGRLLLRLMKDHDTHDIPDEAA